jgi:transposase-like protein
VKRHGGASFRLEELPTEQKENAVVTSDDALDKFRLRVFALAGELDNVQAACRIMGVHPSTYYRWRTPRLMSR